MQEIIGPGPITSRHAIREAVSIHCNKVYDSCRDKDCLEDLRVYLCPEDQELVNSSVSVKARKAEIIWVQTDLEKVPFNKGYFTVDVLYFFNVQLEVFTGMGTPKIVNGLSVFNKHIILFGSEGNAKIYSSKLTCDDKLSNTWRKNNLPKATVEVVDPIALSARLSTKRDHCHKHCDEDRDCGTENILNLSNIPYEILRVFGGELAFDMEMEEDEFHQRPRRKIVLVTLGLFSIVRIERSTQLLIPAYDFAIPDKECTGSCEESPCDMFTRITFPLNEFFPPMARDFAPLGRVVTGSSDQKIGEMMNDCYKPATYC